ncbi:J domain-containing protein [Novosphingobium nitrogenifigens]|uniref:J domain-containing protein n=1 Tax=Novosphingobium nitrogenifigens TaxID=378548 RepID=UPI000361440E|nr:J domain-containing protein [Novosphingobium nitrogenifigens]
MSRQGRTNDWGFPRWRGYGSGREAKPVRMCDRAGCDQPGNCPAPKSPNSPERWYFCERHAAEYNSNWNYFEGLDKEEASAREQAERAEGASYRQSSWNAWAGPGDGSRSRDELRALEVLELDPDADFDAVRKAWRSKAKLVHPDVRPGDEAAAKEFQKLQVAYEVLRAAEERRTWKGPEGTF